MACVPRKTVNVKGDREGCYEGSILPGTMYIIMLQDKSKFRLKFFNPG